MRNYLLIFFAFLVCAVGASGQTQAPATNTLITSPIYRSGTATNTDSVGTVVLASGSTTSPTVTFTGTYLTNGTCLWDTQNATATVKASLGVIAPQVSLTTTSATVQNAPSANVTLQYNCTFHN